MDTPAPLELHREIVRPEWIDYNGHMNVAYYLLAFDHAVDAFLDSIGLDADYRERCRGTTFAADCHITFQREAREGDPLRFSIQLMGYDAKRIHAFQRMFHEETGALAATHEWLTLHVDLTTRRVAPFPEEIIARLQALYELHRRLPQPTEAGRVIRRPTPPETPRPADSV